MSSASFYDEQMRIDMEESIHLRVNVFETGNMLLCDERFESIKDIVKNTFLRDVLKIFKLTRQIYIYVDV